MPRRRHRRTSQRGLAPALALAALLALAVLLAPLRAAAEACSFTTGGVWGPVGTFSGTEDCAVGGGSGITGDDIINFAPGITVTLATGVANRVVMTTGGLTATGGVATLQAGTSTTDETGSIEGGNAGIGTTTAPLALDMRGVCALGPYDSAQTGGAGGMVYRAVGTDCQETDAYFVPNEIIPCTNGDCTANQTILRLMYREARYGSDGTANGWGNTQLDNMIRALVANHHTLCFENFWPTADRQSGELLHCFEVVATTCPAPSAGVDDCSIDIDVRRSVEDYPGNPIQRREMFQGATATVAVVDGQRVIEVDGSTFGTNGNVDLLCLRGQPSCDPLDCGNEEWDYDGTWARFDTNATTTDGDPAVYLVQRVEDDPTAGTVDRITLASPNGINLAAGATLPIGTRVWFGLYQGLQEGERFFVYSPAKINTHTGVAALDDLTNPLYVTADGSSMVNLVMDRIGEWFIFGSQDFTRFRNVWCRDCQTDDDAANSSYLRIDPTFSGSRLTLGEQVKGLEFSGVDTDAPDSCGTTDNDMHCIGFYSVGMPGGGAGGTLSLPGFSCDDFNDDVVFSTTQTNVLMGDGTGFWRCGHIGSGPDTAEVFDLTGDASIYTLGPSLWLGGCGGAEGGAGSTESQVVPSSGGTNTFSDIVAVGGAYDFMDSGTTYSGLTAINTQVVGGAVTSGFRNLAGGGVIREFRNRQTAATSPITGAGDINGVLFRRTHAATTSAGAEACFGIHSTGQDWFNMLIEDHQCPAWAGATFLSQVTTPQSIMRLGLVWRTVASPTSTNLFQWSSCDSTCLFGGILVDGWGGTNTSNGTGGLAAATAAAQFKNWCTSRSAPMSSPATIEGAGGFVDEDIEPGYADTSGLTFGLAAGGHAAGRLCGPLVGADSPGLHSTTIAHRVAGLSAECATEPCETGAAAAAGGGGARFRWGD